MSVRFSVIIPLFNKRAYFGRTLSSLLKQDFRDFEVVVVDDGSTDGSPEMVEALTDPRIRLIRQSNAGPGPARNTAARHAAGEWLALLDADDLWQPDHLSTLDRISLTHPDAGFISTRALWIPVGQLDRQKTMPRGGVIRKLDYFADAGESLVNTSSVAIRAREFRAVGGFGAFCPGEETELYTRLALTTRFAVCDDATAVYLRDNDGIMDQLERAAQERGGRSATELESTLLGALAAPDHAEHHVGIVAYLDRLRLRNARIELYHGRCREARMELAGLSRPMLAQSWSYRLLAAMPPVLVNRIARLYSKLKRRRLGSGGDRRVLGDR